MQRKPYETTVLNTDELATYQPGDSATTQAVAVATLPGPTPPAPIGPDRPEDSFTPEGRSQSGRARRIIRERRFHIELIAAIILIMASVGVGYHAADTQAGQQQSTAARYAYTGWAGTDAAGNPIAVNLLPCQHSPCNNIEVELQLPNAKTGKPVSYLLGGTITADGTAINVSGIYNHVVITVTIICRHAVDGLVTTGSATVDLAYGTTSDTYQVQSATVAEQTAVFIGK